MSTLSTWRHTGVAALSVLALSAGLALANPARAGAVSAYFDANATVNVTLLDDLPADVIVDYEAVVAGSNHSATGALSLASSTPVSAPDPATGMTRFDATFQSHADQGEAGANGPAGVQTGLASADSQSDGYIYIENNSGDDVTLNFEWAIDALVQVGLINPADVLSAGASAFVELLIQVSDGAMIQTIAELSLTALLGGTESDSSDEFGEFAVGVPDGEFREISITLNSGGTSNVGAVPVPATLALLVLGLVGVRAVRGRHVA